MLEAPSKTLLPMPVVIFVRPQASGNIGALARAMSNFEAEELRLVGENPANRERPDDPYQQMDWALAKRGQGILKNAKWFATLEEALGDLHFALGSSGRDLEYDMGYGRPLVTAGEAFGTLQTQFKMAGPLRWALVFGPEDDGLHKSEAALCQKLIRVSTADLNPSMNIAQAAGCLLYHWHLLRTEEALLEFNEEESGAFLGPERAERVRSSERGRTDWAQESQKMDFLNYLMETLSHTKFLKYPDQESVKARIHRWLQLVPIPLGELLFAFEILYHLKSWGSGRFEARNFLSKGEPAAPQSTTSCGSEKPV